MRFAYADPPYLGCGEKYYGRDVASIGGGGNLRPTHRRARAMPAHDDAHIWDDAATHAALIARLVVEYPDGWAVSLHSRSLKTYLAHCPNDVRVAVWKRGSFGGPRVGYSWEPVIFRTTTPETARTQVLDVLTYEKGPARNISGRETPGFIGSKPDRFCQWVLALLGYQAGRDTVDDLFPGTGGMSRAAQSLPFGGKDPE